MAFTVVTVGAVGAMGAVGSAGAWGALGVQASAAYATPLLVASLTAPQGGTVTISGNVSPSSSCPAGTAVQITATPKTGLFPDGLGPQIPRDSNGNFSGTITIPASTPVGSYTIGVLCGTAAVNSTETLIVTAGPQGKPTVAATPTSAKPGQIVTVSGMVPTTGSAQCPAGDAAQLTSTAALFPPNGFGPQGARDATGHFQISYTIPATTPPGTYSIGVRCGGGNTGITVALQVTAATATTTTSVPSTTTTASPTTTTVSPTSTTLAPTVTTAPVTVPASTTTTTLAQVATKNSSKNSSLRWVALAVFVVVVLGALAALLAARRRHRRVRPGI